MNAFNAFLAKLTELVLAPFAGLPSQVPLVILSAVAGVLAAIAFRYTSNQAALKRVADQVRAALLGMRLFKDDLRSVFAAQFSLFKASGLRLWYSLPPLVVLIVPFVLLLVQLGMWYEFRPLAPGQSALVEVEVAPEMWETHGGLELGVPDGVVVESLVRNAHDRLVTWRIRPQRAAGADEPLELRLRLGEREIAAKQLVVREDPDASVLTFVSPRRPGSGFWDRLVYPGEPGFDESSPVRAISIDYGSRTNTIFGLRLPWWATFFVVSILAALAIKPVVKVQF